MTIKNKKNPIKSLTRVKKEKLKKLKKDLSLKLVKSFRIENKREIKRNWTREKIKLNKKEKNQIKNLNNWYKEIINREKYINSKKKHQSERVLKMINLIYPQKSKKKKVFFKNSPKQKHIPFDFKLHRGGLQKLVVNKFNKKILENVIKRGLLRDIYKKGIHFNIHIGNKLVDLRSQALIKNFSSLKNSVKNYDLNIKDISIGIHKKINEKKCGFKNKNKIVNIEKKIEKDKNEVNSESNLDQVLIGNFRGNNLLKNLNNKNIRKRNRRNKRKKVLTDVDLEKPISTIFEFSGCLEVIRRFKEDIKYIKFKIDKFKKELEKEEKKLFKIKNSKKKDALFITSHSGIKEEIFLKEFNKNVENEKNYEDYENNENLRFNELLFQGNNVENIRYSIRKKNSEKIKIENNIVKLLLKLLIKFEFFKYFKKEF